jgi:hypothetical protein
MSSGSGSGKLRDQPVACNGDLDQDEVQSNLANTRSESAEEKLSREKAEG